METAERNYEVHDQELLAVVAAFRHWRHYLEGATHTVEVLTDHNNLKGFIKLKTLSKRQARWAVFLLAFDFQIDYRTSSTNPADGPSRRVDYDVEEDTTSHLLPTL